MNSAESSTNAGPKPRVFYVDLVRALACLLVLFSHVFAPVCSGFTAFPRSVWWIFNLLDSIIRPSAALYVMISGKLFLGSTREESYLTFVWKRYTRVFLPFVAWSLIYVYWSEGETLPMGEALRQVLQGPTAYHLWFMYMILGLYLMMPVLQRFVRHSSRRDIWVSIGLWMGCLSLRFFFPGKIDFGIATPVVLYSGYALLGYALDSMEAARGHIGFWLAGWSFVTLLNAILTYRITIQGGGILNERFYFGEAPLVALQGAAMFVLLKRLGGHPLFERRSRLRESIRSLSAQSYNIYLSHPLWIGILASGLFGWTLSPTLGSRAVLWVGATGSLVLLTCWSQSIVLQKIPGLSRLLVISLQSETHPPSDIIRDHLLRQSQDRQVVSGFEDSKPDTNDRLLGRQAVSLA